MRPIALTACFIAALLLAPSNATASSWRWPVHGPLITPYANGVNPYAAGQHRGIDIAAPSGAQVVAAAGGTVTFAGLAGSSGLAVAVRTEDGLLHTSYLHLSIVQARTGDRLAAGDSLGAVGTTGRRSSARPHLHFGVRDASSRFAYRDPLDFLPPPTAAPDPAPRPLPVPVPVTPHTAPPTLAAAEPTAMPTLSPPAIAPGPAAAGQVGPHAPIDRSAVPTGARVHEAAAPQPHGRATRGRSDGPRSTAAPLPAAGPRARTPGTSPPPLRPIATHARAPRDGLDLGWLAACIAMVAAAALLGRPRASANSLRTLFDLTPATTSRHTRTP